MKKLLLLIIICVCIVGCVRVEDNNQIVGEKDEIKKTVVDFAVGYDFCAVLYDDGSVESTRGCWSSHDSQSKWRDVISIDCGYSTIVGLRKDGSVVSSDYKDDVDSWKNVKKVWIGDDSSSYIVAVTKNNKVMTTGRRPEWKAAEEWGDMIAVAAGDTYIAGITSEKEVLYTSNILKNDYLITDKEIADIDNGGFLCIIYKDGTIDFPNSDNYYKDANEWNNIVQVSQGCGGVFGLTAEGTVLYDGRISEYYSESYYNEEEFKNVSRWKDVVKIDSNDWSVVGLTRDGRLLHLGKDFLGFSDILFSRY